MVEPLVWNMDQLQEELVRSVEFFRRERMEEPLEDYLEAFDEDWGTVDELMEATADLSQLSKPALEVLTDARLLEAFRYLAGPPISQDDLKTLAEAASLNPKRLRADEALVRRIVQVVILGLDRRRFPWILQEREPTEAERSAAVIASAALMATQKAGTKRRHAGKGTQEARVEEALLASNFLKVPTRQMDTLAQAPGLGEFCRESVLGNRKADFAVRLWDYRVMAIECKVSNSATNPVKRLNHDAAAKAEVWRRDFGATQVVPTAVLGGVYKLRNLEDAQRRGLTLFWVHKLEEMTGWVEQTRAD